MVFELEIQERDRRKDIGLVVETGTNFWEKFDQNSKIHGETPPSHSPFFKESAGGKKFVKKRRQKK